MEVGRDTGVTWIVYGWNMDRMWLDRGQNLGPGQGPGGNEAEAPSHRQAEADREAFVVRCHGRAILRCGH